MLNYIKLDQSLKLITRFNTLLEIEKNVKRSSLIELIIFTKT